jgi:pimeloyl-ACP methyl ester carboxylesterase
MSKGTSQERQPFDVAWRTIDGLKVRYATGGKGDERVVLFSPWPESIFAFAPVWEGLAKRFEVLALDLPGFGRSEARDDLFAPQKMGEFIAKAIEAFGFASVHGVGLDVGAPSVLFASLVRPSLFRSLIVGAGATTYPLVTEDGAGNRGYDGVVATPKNTCEFVVGRLLEIRVAGFRSSADIHAQTAGVAQAVASLPKDTKYVIAGDWRAAQIMAPKMAAGAAEMLARVNPSIARSGILTLPEHSTANMQIFRIVREAQNPNRRHFTSASAMHRWLSEELTPGESARLRIFLERP